MHVPTPPRVKAYQLFFSIAGGLWPRLVLFYIKHYIYKLAVVGRFREAGFKV